MPRCCIPEKSRPFDSRKQLLIEGVVGDITQNAGNKHLLVLIRRTAVLLVVIRQVVVRVIDTFRLQIGGAKDGRQPFCLNRCSDLLHERHVKLQILRGLVSNLGLRHQVIKYVCMQINGFDSDTRVRDRQPYSLIFMSMDMVAQPKGGVREI